jgi:hypothetical protein
MLGNRRCDAMSDELFAALEAEGMLIRGASDL